MFLSAKQNFLALYSFSNQQISASLKFLYRARYLLSLIHGQNHPEMAIIDVSCLFTCQYLICLSNLYLCNYRATLALFCTPLASTTRRCAFSSTPLPLTCTTLAVVT